MKYRAIYPIIRSAINGNFIDDNIQKMVLSLNYPQQHHLKSCIFFRPLFQKLIVVLKFDTVENPIS